MAVNMKADNQNEIKKSTGFFDFKTKPNWKYVMIMSIAHAIGFYGYFTFPYTSCKLTLLWSLFVANVAKFGETGGAHRLWAHRSYKAKWPLRLILLFCFLTNGVFKVTEWVKFHRVHHKYTDSDADPHNTKRGFFYSHMGWLMLEKHPDVRKRIRELDVSDLKADPIVRFGDNYFLPITLICCFIIPTIVPVYFWNENWQFAFFAVLMRYMFQGHLSASINSFAHAWGSKPYDKNISPVENKTLAILTLGEGWHNYHHIFPWDYKAAEFPIYNVNVTTFLIEQFSKIGWAYDLKQPSPELIKATCLKRGDGSHQIWGSEVPAPVNQH